MTVYTVTYLWKDQTRVTLAFDSLEKAEAYVVANANNDTSDGTPTDLASAIEGLNAAGHAVEFDALEVR